MIKFKRGLARIKFKFKSKLATRVKFRAHTVFTKAVSPKRICLAAYRNIPQAPALHTEL